MNSTILSREKIPFLRVSSLVAFALISHATALQAGPNEFKQTNLSSDIPGLAANTDPDLKNPWGMSASATSPFWVSDAGTGKSTLYNGAGVKQGLVVSIPGSAPISGQVFSGGSGGFNGDTFLFAGLNGTITGWRGALGTTAEVLSTNAGSAYTGLALGKTGGNAYAYAADFANNNISVLKGTAAAPDLTGLFKDSSLPSGYSAFNIQNFGDKLYVTYALRSDVTGHDVAGAGNGLINVFDLNGNLDHRFTTGGSLNSPWGLAIAPTGFGPFGGDLLVGNFGDGTIDAYDLGTGAYVDSLRDANHNPIAIEGLWGLSFGNGAAGTSKDTLYFVAGISGNGDPIESHGLYGSLSAVPDTGSTLVLTAAGLMTFVVLRRRVARNLAPAAAA